MEGLRRQVELLHAALRPLHARHGSSDSLLTLSEEVLSELHMALARATALAQWAATHPGERADTQQPPRHTSASTRPSGSAAAVLQTLATVAETTKVAVADLRRWNPQLPTALRDDDALPPDTFLKFLPPRRPSPTASAPASRLRPVSPASVLSTTEAAAAAAPAAAAAAAASDAPPAAASASASVASAAAPRSASSRAKASEAGHSSSSRSAAAAARHGSAASGSHSSRSRTAAGAGDVAGRVGSTAAPLSNDGGDSQGRYSTWTAGSGRGASHSPPVPEPSPPNSSAYAAPPTCAPVPVMRRQPISPRLPPSGDELVDLREGSAAASEPSPSPASVAESRPHRHRRHDSTPTTAPSAPPPPCPATTTAAAVATPPEADSAARRDSTGGGSGVATPRKIHTRGHSRSSSRSPATETRTASADAARPRKTVSVAATGTPSPSPSTDTAPRAAVDGGKARPLPSPGRDSSVSLSATSATSATSAASTVGEVGRSRRTRVGDDGAKAEAGAVLPAVAVHESRPLSPLPPPPLPQHRVATASPSLAAPSEDSSLSPVGPRRPSPRVRAGAAAGAVRVPGGPAGSAAPPSRGVDDGSPRGASPSIATSSTPGRPLRNAAAVLSESPRSYTEDYTEEEDEEEERTPSARPPAMLSRHASSPPPTVAGRVGGATATAAAAPSPLQPSRRRGAAPLPGPPALPVVTAAADAVLSESPPEEQPAAGGRAGAAAAAADGDEDYDTLEGIATAYGLSVSTIVEWNPYLKKYAPREPLPPDLPIVLPMSDAEEEEEDEAGEDSRTPSRLSSRTPVAYSPSGASEGSPAPQRPA
ncbi:LysM domain containing protein [Novymonas esmeraldas]|uniref:LysM domain containing protein n=1 Tax=Novymonas esmeraldas TaxID=1808958 RepID=A0AAW0EKB0_9TRYP